MTAYLIGSRKQAKIMNKANGRKKAAIAKLMPRILQQVER